MTVEHIARCLMAGALIFGIFASDSAAIAQSRGAPPSTGRPEPGIQDLMAMGGDIFWADAPPDTGATGHWTVFGRYRENSGWRVQSGALPEYLGGGARTQREQVELFGVETKGWASPAYVFRNGCGVGFEGKGHTSAVFIAAQQSSRLKAVDVERGVPAPAAQQSRATLGAKEGHRPLVDYLKRAAMTLCQKRTSECKISVVVCGYDNTPVGDGLFETGYVLRGGTYTLTDKLNPR